MVKKKKEDLRIYKILSKFDDPEDIDTPKLARKLGITQQAVAGHMRAAQAPNSKIPQKMRKRGLKPAPWFANQTKVDIAEHAPASSNTAEYAQAYAQNAGTAETARYSHPTTVTDTWPRNYRSSPLSVRSSPLSTSAQEWYYDYYTGKMVPLQRESQPSPHETMLDLLRYQMAFDMLADFLERRSRARERDRRREELSRRQAQLPEWQVQQIHQQYAAQYQYNSYLQWNFFMQMINEFIQGFTKAQQLLFKDTTLSDPQQITETSPDVSPRSMTEVLQDWNAEKKGLIVIRDSRGQFIGYAVDDEKYRSLVRVPH